MKKLGKLSDVEMELMQTIWKLAAPVTVSQLVAIYKNDKGWKTSTLSTMLERIISKGFLRKDMKGKVNYYRPIATLGEYQKQEGRNIISSLYGGSIKNFMAALVDGDDITDTEVKELQEWFQNSIRKDGDTS